MLDRFACYMMGISTEPKVEAEPIVDTNSSTEKERIDLAEKQISNNLISSGIAEVKEVLSQIEENEELIDTYISLLEMHQAEINHTASEESIDEGMDTIQEAEDLLNKIIKAKRELLFLEERLIRKSSKLNLNREDEIRELSVLKEEVLERLHAKLKKAEEEIDKLKDIIIAIDDEKKQKLTEEDQPKEVAGEHRSATPSLPREDDTDSERSSDGREEAVANFTPPMNDVKKSSSTHHLVEYSDPINVDEEFAPVDTSTLFAVSEPDLDECISDAMVQNRLNVASPLYRPILDFDKYSAHKRDHTNQEIMAELTKRYANQTSEEKYFLSRVSHVLENDKYSETKMAIKPILEDMFRFATSLNKKALERVIYNLAVTEFSTSLDQLVDLAENQSADDKKALCIDAHENCYQFLDYCRERNSKFNCRMYQSESDRLNLIQALGLSSNLVDKACNQTLTHQECKEYNQYAGSLRLSPEPKSQELGQFMESIFTTVLVAVGIAACFTPVGWVGAGIAAASIFFVCAAKKMQEREHYTASTPMKELSDSVLQVSKISAKM